LSIPDRGDGCVYAEVFRDVIDGREQAVLQDLACELFFLFDPQTNTLTAWIP
jgi:hypothetical protein